MSKVVHYMSMSLDGFVTAAGISPEQPLGIDGERLHGWVADPQGKALLDQAIQNTGATIVPVLFGDGTRLYEHGGGHHVQLDFVEAIPTPAATHLHYRVRK